MKLYVIVRSDLSRAQQAVQAGHAVAAFCIEDAHRVHWDGRDVNRLPIQWENGTLVYLAVPNEEALRELHDQLKNCVAFHEPHYQYSMTAIAHLGGHELLEYLPLMGSRS